MGTIEGFNQQPIFQGKIDELTIEITRQCPLNCLLCSSNGGIKYEREVSVSQIRSIVDYASKIGLRKVSISGGEPFEHPHLIEICELIKKLGIYLEVYTSGNIGDGNGLTKSIESETLHALKLRNVDAIVFSVHGPNPYIHEKTTQHPGSYNKLIESIKKTIMTGLRSEAHIVPTKINYLSLPSVIEILNQLGVQKVSILRFVPQGRGLINRDVLELNQNELVSLYNIVNALGEDIKLRFGAPFNSISQHELHQCTAGLDKATIRADGKVFPCVSMKGIFSDEEGINIFESSFDHIWKESHLFIEIRNLIYSSAKKVSESECEYRKFCIMECPTQRMLAIQPDSPQPIPDAEMKMTEISKELLEQI